MKICEILASQGEGGLEKHMLDLCNSMAEQGHEVHVVVSPYFAERFVPAVIVHSIDMNRSRNNVVLLWQLFGILKNISADIIHAQANKATSLLARIKPFLGTTPCVGTVHNQKSKSSMFRSMDGVIGVSKGATSVPVHDHKRAIYNGVTISSDDDLSSRCRQQLMDLVSIEGQRPIAIALVRLVEVKRIDLLLQAWQGIEADLLIVGDGPLRLALEQQASELKLMDRVHFAGFVKDAAKLLPGADFMVMSSDREGFPYSMVEALTAKVPVISTQVAAAVEALPLSLQVPLGNHQALHDKICDFIENEKGESYQTDLDQLFSWSRTVLSLENMTNETVLFLQETIDRKRLTVTNRNPV